MTRYEEMHRQHQFIRTLTQHMVDLDIPFITEHFSAHPSDLKLQFDVSVGPGIASQPLVKLAADIYGNVLSDESRDLAGKKEDAKKLLDIFWSNEETRGQLESEMKKTQPCDPKRLFRIK